MRAGGQHFVHLTMVQLVGVNQLRRCAQPSPAFAKGKTHGIGLYHFRRSFGDRGMIRRLPDEGLDAVFGLEPFLAPTRFR
jgi:hypothetical protein